MLSKLTAAMRLQRSLTELEDALEISMAKAAQLQADMLAARSAEGVDRATGQATLLRMHATNGHLVKASTDTARMHRELRKLNDEVKAMPDENGECPKPSALKVRMQNKVA